MKKIFTVVSMLAIIGAKCRNKNDNSIQTATGKLLTRAAWKRIAATGQIKGQPEEDTWTGQLDCVKDNLYIFLPDKKFATDEGGQKCFSDDPQYENKATWELRDNEKSLVIKESEELGGAEFFYEIVELTGTSLKLKRMPGTFTVTESYSH
jgi:hypothetical protein